MKALALAVLLAAAPAMAQVPPAELGQRYIPAPWWLREPVVASMGMVKVELPANRARLGARFGAVERTAADASSAAAKKVRELDQSLRAVGADKVQLTTTFVTRPLYDQYRQKDGTMVDNQRADKIDSYEVTAQLFATVRDIAVLERVYRLMVAAKPTGIDPIAFSLEPDNATRTWLQAEAVRDAARRARLAAESAGSHLGSAKVIDPSGGVCDSQLLSGWPSYVGGTQPTSVERPERMERYQGSPIAVSAMAAAPAPPPSLDQQAAAVQVTLQPPIEQLTDRACVIYALLP